jgi:oligopeptide/dipeptide ABC transporter ATP-binding protein
MKNILLEVNNLSVELSLRGGTIKPVDKVSFCVSRGETLGIVGESGCGKSLMSLSIMQLLPQDIGKVSVNSSIRLNGVELLGLTENKMREVRGSKISMVLQDAMSVLNPVITIERQIVDTLRAHRKISKKEARKLAVEMLAKVGIPSPELRMKEYPHQLSGGMKQRVTIAISLLCAPDVLIADEPTTALDVTIQAQILELLNTLKASSNMAILFITHDLGVVSAMADKILVMYAGQVAEYANARDLFRQPLHPYTQGLLGSIPRIGTSEKKLAVIPGQVPHIGAEISGCRFHPRCNYVAECCRKSEPPTYTRNNRCVKCWLFQSWEGAADEQGLHSGRN